MLPIAKSVGRLGQTYPSVAAALSYVRDAGAIVPWNEFWENYFEWELEAGDDSTVRIRTNLAAVGEDAADAATHDVYGLWPRIRCPILLVRARKPVGPDGGLVVSAEDAERFAAEIAGATVVDVDSDHYTVMIDPVAIQTIARFTQVSTG
jgi:pimeloyl-ACP methyl ester carboxylesterase